MNNFVTHFGEVLVTEILPSTTNPGKPGIAFGVLVDDEEQPSIYIPSAHTAGLNEGDTAWFRIAPNWPDKVELVPWRVVGSFPKSRE